MAFLTSTVSGTLPASAGTVSLTDPAVFGGLSPKGAIIMIGEAPVDGVPSGDGIMAVALLGDLGGVANYGMYVEDAANPTVCSNYAVFNEYLIAEAGGPVGGRGTIAAIADGIEFTPTVHTTAYHVFAILFGGDEIDRCHVHNHGSASSSTYNITGVGFQPDVVVGLSNGIEFLQGDAGLSLGVAGMHNGVTLTQATNALFDRNGQAGALPRGASRTGKLHAVPAAGPGYALQTTINSFNSDGFNVTRSVLGYTFESFLCFKLADPAKVHIETTVFPSSAASWTSSAAAFEPKLALLSSNDLDGTTNGINNYGYGIGLHSYDGSDPGLGPTMGVGSVGLVTPSEAETLRCGRFCVMNQDGTRTLGFSAIDPTNEFRIAFDGTNEPPNDIPGWLLMFGETTGGNVGDKIKFGDLDVDDMRFGDVAIDAMYFGDIQVF